MAVSFFGGWIKHCVTISFFLLLVGCSYGELPSAADTEQLDDGDAAVILDEADSTFYDANSDWYDVSEPDVEVFDVQYSDGWERTDSGEDVIDEEDVARDAHLSDANTPESDTGWLPDVSAPEPDVNPPAPCARVKITLSAGTTIRTSARISATAVGTLRKNSVVVTRSAIYGDSVGGSTIWYRIESPAGNGYIPSAHVGCTNDAPYIEPPPLSEVCPRVRITATTGVNIRRDSDGTGYVGGLCHGSIVEVVARVKGLVVEGDDTWYQIKSPKGNGYITGKYAECTHNALHITNC